MLPSGAANSHPQLYRPPPSILPPLPSMLMTTMTMIHPLMPPPPLPLLCPNLPPHRELRCCICRHPSQVRHNGRSYGRAATPVHKVSNSPIIHTAGKDLVHCQRWPPSSWRGLPKEPLVQLSARLPLLPRVHGRNDPPRLAQCQERPAVGPHKGGTSHLCDEVRVDVRAVNGYEPLIAEAEVAKAFGGRVRQCPRLTPMLAVHLDQPAKRCTPRCPTTCTSTDVDACAPPDDIATAMSIKGGQMWRSGVTFDCGSGGGGGWQRWQRGRGGMCQREKLFWQ